MNLLVAVLLLAQAIPAATPKAPDLSISEKTAITSMEKVKNDAVEQFNQANQIEEQIKAEFAQEHPGWHLGPAPQFSVAANPPAPPITTVTPKGK